VTFDELDRRQHFSVACRLEESYVFGTGVDHVHPAKVDPLPWQPLPQMPRHHEIRCDGNRTAVAQKERALEERVEVGLHDQVRRLAIRQPHTAHRRDSCANHHGE
jgi:hypothetical protein